jgi:hypothetical protein
MSLFPVIIYKQETPIRPLAGNKFLIAMVLDKPVKGNRGGGT